MTITNLSNYFVNYFEELGVLDIMKEEGALITGGCIGDLIRTPQMEANEDMKILIKGDIDVFLTKDSASKLISKLTVDNPNNLVKFYRTTGRNVTLKSKLWTRDQMDLNICPEEVDLFSYDKAKNLIGGFDFTCLRLGIYLDKSQDSPRFIELGNGVEQSRRKLLNYGLDYEEESNLICLLARTIKYRRKGFIMSVKLAEMLERIGSSMSDVKVNELQGANNPYFMESTTMYDFLSVYHDKSVRSVVTDILLGNILDYEKLAEDREKTTIEW